MKQVLQSLADGTTSVADVPCPRARKGELLARTTVSLLSAGTERMLVDFGKASLVNKARQQPDKVRMVIDKARTDGVASTVDAIRSKLDQPLALGYCNVGRVSEVGAEVDGIAIGDRVVSNGHHAEVVAVAKNLSARIPDDVTDEQAAFTVLGAIGLQGVRLANPTLGECVVVFGLGLIGLLTVQLLRAQGCRVLGLDYDPSRLAMAERFGAEVVNIGDLDPLSAAEAFSRGRGVDAVLIAASTKSNEPVSQAAKMCRQRGRIVLVGVVGLALSRADFYAKELSFQVSCSYGPGRYDPAYEEQGRDYPVGFVRWTQQRNFEAVLDLMAAGKLDLDPLISHRFAIDQAEQAYARLSGEHASLGILLSYPVTTQDEPFRRVVRLHTGDRTGHAPAVAMPGEAPSLGFIGAGNYAGRVLIPAFAKTGAVLHTLVSSGGVSAVHFGKKFGFHQAATDIDQLLAEDAVNAVVIATRHDSHARYVVAGLQAGKSVFVEKPLCLSLQQLTEIEAAMRVFGRPANGLSEQAEHCSKRSRLMIGFNRRFSPQVKKIKALIDPIGAPKAMVMTVNAGAIGAEHWTQDASVGGGRVVGEACHFIDLLRFLAAAPIVDHDAKYMDASSRDSVSISLKFADGSIGTVHYLANGHKAVAKERLDLFCAGRTLRLDNFRKLSGHGWPHFKRARLWRQDKGQVACAAAFVAAVREGVDSPIGFDEIAEVSRVSIDIAQAT